MYDDDDEQTHKIASALKIINFIVAASAKRIYCNKLWMATKIIIIKYTIFSLDAYRAFSNVIMCGYNAPFICMHKFWYFYLTCWRDAWSIHEFFRYLYLHFALSFIEEKNRKKETERTTTVLCHKAYTHARVYSWKQIAWNKYKIKEEKLKLEKNAFRIKVMRPKDKKDVCRVWKSQETAEDYMTSMCGYFSMNIVCIICFLLLSISTLFALPAFGRSVP